MSASKRCKLPRRGVVLCSETSERDKGRRLWAFSYADLSQLLDCTEEHCRYLVNRKKLDPSNLEGLCRFWLERQGASRPSQTPSQ